MTSIWHAAKRGDSVSLRRLIAQGGNINETGGAIGMTPIAISAYCEKYDCVSILLDKNADVMAIDNDGFTALFRFLSMFASREPKKGPISHAESELIVDIAHRMLDLGANPSIMVNGDSIMSMAIDMGVFALVKLLVRKGADPSAVCFDLGMSSHDYPPKTALTYAIDTISENSLEVVQLLIDLGAELSISEGLWPLIAAIEWTPCGLQNPEDMVRLLLDNGVFLSEEFADPAHEMTDEDEYDNDNLGTPIASVEWLTAYATRKNRPLSAAIIRAEPANRERKLKWEEEAQKMRRDALDAEGSSIDGLNKDMMRLISGMI